MKKAWTLKDVAAHWDSVPDYDGANGKLDSYMRRFTDSAPLFSIPDNALVLDMDCRTGNGTSFHAKTYPSAKWHCVASASSFEKITRKHLAEEGISADIQQLTEFPLPFEDEYFDVVLCYETLEHMPDPELLIIELSRVLKPGGTFVLTTPNVLWEPVHLASAALHFEHGEGPHRMIPRKEIFAGYKKANLNVITEITTVLIPAGPKWLLKFGRWCEKVLTERGMRLLGLRRIFICQKYE
ncbi:methyltransferase domain-containing protein [Candidatus Peregrinibacteria bacterium]|jgi:SAM-dependent methyltransferase|nr:methyltransferase domain-containing protein [Candidatus Peregrinibacteria bacterium]MBT4366987.1 methyltransferase domain-containing protein [Candidatus Peregrinibacteria bacterium]MBT6730456.1 methyltransferase domain-containing protein [Candidatus Peregrinibacteria bacterium]